MGHKRGVYGTLLGRGFSLLRKKRWSLFPQSVFYLDGTAVSAEFVFTASLAMM